MNTPEKKSLHPASRMQSFGYALNGLRLLIAQEPNARIHLMATIAVIIAGFVRHISPMQWAALTFAIGLVWITEALNTCIEKLCNIWCDHRWHEEVKIIKDIAAGAVLVSAGVSLTTGIVVFFF